MPLACAVSALGDQGSSGVGGGIASCTVPRTCVQSVSRWGGERGEGEVVAEWRSRGHLGGADDEGFATLATERCGRQRQNGLADMKWLQSWLYPGGPIFFFRPSFIPLSLPPRRVYSPQASVPLTPALQHLRDDLMRQPLYTIADVAGPLAPQLRHFLFCSTERKQWTGPALEVSPTRPPCDPKGRVPDPPELRSCFGSQALLRPRMRGCVLA